MMIDNIVRKISWMACILLVVLCSCNNSKYAYKKRRKPAPCDCPKFNYVPQNDPDRDVVHHIVAYPFVPPFSTLNF